VLSSSRSAQLHAFLHWVINIIIRLHKSLSALNNYGMCLNYHHCLSNEVTQNLNNFKTVTSATNIHIRNDQNGNEKRYSNNSNNGNGTANGVISDATHGLYQGVLYYQSLVRFYATHLNVIPFTTSRLRHCATSRKVADSITDGVTGIFPWHNPSDRTVALELTQPLAEMSTRNISWVVKAAGTYGWQPYYLHVPTVLKSGSLNVLEASGPVLTCNGTALPFAFTMRKVRPFLRRFSRNSNQLNRIQSSYSKFNSNRTMYVENKNTFTPLNKVGLPLRHFSRNLSMLNGNLLPRISHTSVTQYGNSIETEIHFTLQSQYDCH